MDCEEVGISCDYCLDFAKMCLVYSMCARISPRFLYGFVCAGQALVECSSSNDFRILLVIHEEKT